MTRLASILALSLAILFAIKLASQTIRPVPVINIDCKAHTITSAVNCDGDNVITLDMAVDGVYVMTIYLPPPSPTLLSIQ